MVLKSSCLYWLLFRTFLVSTLIAPNSQRSLKCSLPDLVFPHFPVLLFWAPDQLAHWLCFICISLPQATTLFKVDDKVHCLKTYSFNFPFVFQDDSGWGCWEAVVYIWLTLTYQANLPTNQTWIFSFSIKWLKKFLCCYRYELRKRY